MKVHNELPGLIVKAESIAIMQCGRYGNVWRVVALDQNGAILHVWPTGYRSEYNAKQSGIERARRQGLRFVGVV